LIGSASGIADTIRLSMWANSFLAQICAVGGVVVASLSVLRAMRNEKVGLAAKLVLIPSTTLVLLGVMVSMRVAQVDPDGVLAMALAAGAAALGAGAQLLRSATERALGLTLLGCGSAAIFSAGGRSLALRAGLEGDASYYLAARLAATVGFAAELAVLGLVLTWLYRSSSSGARLKAGGIIAVASLVSVVSMSATHHDSGTLVVLVSRSVGELLRQPAPYVPDLLRGWLELSALGVALWALLRSRPAPLVAAMGLCLVARGATDVPLLALALTVAASASLSSPSTSRGAARVELSRAAAKQKA
jgi:hypothetical protein